jgi:hypothetical protein
MGARICMRKCVLAFFLCLVTCQFVTQAPACNVTHLQVPGPAGVCGTSHTNMSSQAPLTDYRCRQKTDLNPPGNTSIAN